MRGAHCGVFGFGRRAFGMAADNFRNKVVNVVFALFFVRRVFTPDNLPILYDVYAVVSVIAVKFFIRADTYAQAVRPEEVGDDLAKARPAVMSRSGGRKPYFLQVCKKPSTLSRPPFQCK